MNINTDIINSNYYSSSSLLYVFNRRSPDDVFAGCEYDVGLNKEVPIFILSPRNYLKYDLKYVENKEISEFTLINSISAHKTSQIEYRVNPIKSIDNKFYEVFKRFQKAIKYIIKGNVYFVAKGFISDGDFNPYIMTTYVFTGQEDCDLINLNHTKVRDLTQGLLGVDRNKLKIYLARRIFSSEFKANHKRMHKEIFEVILPQLINLNIQIIVKEDLDLLSRPYTDPALNTDALKSKFEAAILEEKEEYILENHSDMDDMEL